MEYSNRFKMIHDGRMVKMYKADGTHEIYFCYAGDREVLLNSGWIEIV